MAQIGGLNSPIRPDPRARGAGSTLRAGSPRFRVHPPRAGPDSTHPDPGIGPEGPSPLHPFDARNCSAGLIGHAGADHPRQRRGSVGA